MIDRLTALGHSRISSESLQGQANSSVLGASMGKGCNAGASSSSRRTSAFPTWEAEASAQLCSAVVKWACNTASSSRETLQHTHPAFLAPPHHVPRADDDPRLRLSVSSNLARESELGRSSTERSRRTYIARSVREGKQRESPASSTSLEAAQSAVEPSARGGYATLGPSAVHHDDSPSPPLCETDTGALTRGSRSEPGGEPPPGKSIQPGSQAQMHDDQSSSAGRKPPIYDKTSWSYILRSGLAGGIAGCVAKTAIAPLDRVKILFQAQNPEFAKYSGKALGVFRAANDIVRNQGLMALFQGHSATLLRIFPYAAIKYMAYDKLHFYLMPTSRDETSARLFLAGSASGVLSVFMTYPLELIRVRLAFETKGKRGGGGLRNIIKQIYSEGTTEAPFSSDARKRAARNALGTIKNPTSGAATAAAHLSTSASQSQAIAAAAGPHSGVSASSTSSTLLARYPLLKFYRGFSVTVMGMIPYAGTSFLVFGRCKTALQDMFPPQEESLRNGGMRKWWWPSKTMVDLTAGALAGAISQTAAYPFEVIRRRQQVGGAIRPGSLVGMRETAAFIWRTSGFRGFYVGLSIGFLKVVPMTSIR